jgi:transcriptional regulator with XRE-family HTH domain
MPSDIDHLIQPGDRRKGITPAQCCAARHLLGIRAADLSRMSGVSLGAIKNFEQNRVVPQARTIRDLRVALETEGITFDARIDESKITLAIALTRPSQAA